MHFTAHVESYKFEFREVPVSKCLGTSFLRHGFERIPLGVWAFAPWPCWLVAGCTCVVDGASVCSLNCWGWEPKLVAATGILSLNCFLYWKFGRTPRVDIGNVLGYWWYLNGFNVYNPSIWGVTAVQLNLWGLQQCLNLPGILKLPIGMAILCQIQIQIPMRSWCSQEGDAEASYKPVGDETYTQHGQVQTF